jgi:DNA-3-methyladenine glycosylase
VIEVAQRLLGKRLVTSVGGILTSLILCEVEAYGGSDDPASHAFPGPRMRNRNMFSAAGVLYVYRSYGIHWCANVVTGKAGEGQAVLLRGGLPECGMATMIARRGRAEHLCDGPGKLTQALGIEGRHDGLTLADGKEVWLEDTGDRPPEWRVTPRVGISMGIKRPWRLVAVGNGYRPPKG